MAKDLEAPKPFVPSVFSDGARLDAGNVEEMRFGLAGSGPLAKAVLDSNAVGTMRQLVGGGATPTTTIPVGTISPYAGTSAPANWLLCDGSAVSRATYAALFAVTSTAYGAGDGSTTFNVPDLRGRIVVGSGTGAQQGAAGSGVITGGTALTARSVGQFFGDERTELHTHTQNSHSHGGSTGNDSPDHSHATAQLSNLSVAAGGAPFHANYSPYNLSSGGASTRHQHVINADTATNQNTFAGTGANTQPSVVTSYIIKAIPDVSNTFGVALAGAAGGDLTGTYPNPTLAASIPTNLKIANASPTITIAETTGVAQPALQLLQNDSALSAEGAELRYDSSSGNSYLRSSYSAGNLYLGSGSSSAAQVRIDSGGRLLTGNQPICQLYNQTGRNPDAAMSWTGTYVNIGSMWNGSDRVTVPVAGIYLATYEGMSWNDVAGGSYYLDLFLNGGMITAARQYTNAPSQHQHIAMHVYVSCGANDFFQWVPRGIRAYSDAAGYQHASVALVA